MYLIRVWLRVLLLALFQLLRLECSPTSKNEGNETVYRTATVGESIALPCYTNETDADVSWWHQSSPSQQASEVSSVGRLLNGYNKTDRFQLDNPTAGLYQLIVRQLQLSDAGIYTCVDKDGFGKRRSVHLNVLETTVTLMQHSAVTVENYRSTTGTVAGISDMDSADVADANSVKKIVIPTVTVSVIVLTALLILAVWYFWRNKRSRPSADGDDEGAEHPLNDTSSDFWRRTLERVENARNSTVKITEHIAKSLRDIFLLTKRPPLFKKYVELLTNHIRHSHPDVIVGLDTRGFVFGVLVSQYLNVPFVPIRKAGKLLGDTYTAEHRTRKNETVQIEVQKNACTPGQKVIIVDDELATGGSMMAAVELMQQLNVTVLECVIVTEICKYHGRQTFSEKFAEIPVFSLIQFTE